MATTITMPKHLANPGKDPIPEDDLMAFISGAGKGNNEAERDKMVQISLKLSAGLLADVDAAAKRLGISRAAYFKAAVSTAVANGITLK
ncbi:MAG: hypothetical protein J5492_02435 [Oxalobacter sp.]|jgi:hypothetical protein|nr:hypothetical protein [Oxalobacter sp.]